MRWRAVTAMMLVSAIASAQPNQPVLIAPDSLTDAWAYYDDAFRLAAAGKRDEARARLSELVAKFPDHPSAARARALIVKLASAPEGDEDGDDRSGRPNKVARGEFVFWTTVGSIFIGANICEMGTCDSNRATAATFLVTTGGALAGSLLLSGDIQQGEAQLYNSAQTWMAWNSFAVNDGFAHDTGEAATAIGMQVAGGGLAYGLWHSWHPTQGDVALANTFFLWGTLFGVEAQAVADVSIGFRSTVILGDIALAAGALISTKVRMSRGRTLMLDVGGVLGALGGGIVALASDSSRAVAGSLLGGSAAGIAIAWASTVDWDVKTPPVQLVPTPMTAPGTQTTTMGISAIASF